MVRSFSERGESFGLTAHLSKKVVRSSLLFRIDRQRQKTRE